MNENGLREQIARLAKSMFDRGLTRGSSGNISVRVDDVRLMPDGFGGGLSSAVFGPCGNNL